MSEDFVTFKIRCEKALFELKIKSPKDISGFVKKLKNKLKLDESDDLVILCPVTDGNMMEIQSDDDIEFLKVLSNKLKLLASQVDELSNVFNKIIHENESSVISTIFRSILAENSEIDLGNKSMKKCSGKPSGFNLSNLETNIGQKKTKKDDEKLSSSGTSNISSTLF
eukprot:XP_016658642.1 PREDICTED: uncharacterized protein LOC100570394 isoform X2 [Acyrthosiphon pisum]